MENNNIPTVKTRKCVCCGKVLPITAFKIFGKRGYHTKCKVCEGEEITPDGRFKDVSSRELIIELRARGYTGKLQKVTIDEVVI